MRDLLEGLIQAIDLIFSLDQTLYEIIWFSLYVSGVALTFSILVGIPLGALLGLKGFFGRRFIMALLYTGMGFPPVVIGLFVYLVLSRSVCFKKAKLKRHYPPHCAPMSSSFYMSWTGP
jgi:tungstate transport system permease protein